jgi:hypothetical protein
MNEELIAEIRKYGKRARGKRELIEHLEGKRITPRKAIAAKCFECCCYFADGLMDCKIPKCPCYPFMPFREERQTRKLPLVQ